MSANTSIEWTDATWNPVRGCSIVSPGCTNCYAMRQAHRFSGKGKPYYGLTEMSKGGPVWTGSILCDETALDWPLRKKKPLRIFVNSMSDLFHEDVPDEFIDRVFSVMGQCEDGGWRPHTFQILTKRAARMHQYVTTRGYRAWNAGRMNHNKWPAPNVWLGVSVEDQRRADERIPLLLQTPAAVRWISAEPLLGPVSLRWLAAWDGQALKPRAPGVETNELDGLRKLDWVVVGGESGPGARPFDITWARALRDQCRAAGVPFFLKQLGAWPVVYRNEAEHIAASGGRIDWDDSDEHVSARIVLRDRKGGDALEWPEDLRIREYPSA